MTFPIRPRHIPGEPASGYARRLAEANGCDWRANPFAGRGVSTTLLARGDTRALVPILGRETVDGIDRYSPRRMRDGHILLNGEKLEPAQVFYERQCCCVACWADDAACETDGTVPMRHLRCWWSVAAVSVCPIHNLRLNDRCLQCDRTIRLAGARVTVCRCGANLARSPRIVVEPHATAADAYVVGRLGGCPRVPEAILDALPLCDAIALMQRLGCCVSAGRDVRFGKTDPADRPAMMLAGFHAVRTGDKGIEKTIDALLAAPGRPDRLRVQLGQLYSWFAALPDGELQSWMANRIANVVRRNQLCWQGWERHVVEPPTPDRISASRAKACLDAGWDRTVAILEAAGLRSDVDERCRPTVDRRQVEMLASRVGRFINVDILAGTLGITPASVRKLVAADILPRGPLALAAFRHPRFDPIEVDAILDRMQGNAPVVEVPPSDSVSIVRAARKVGIVALCRAILDGQIVATARVVGTPGLAGIRIRSAGIAELSRARNDPWIGPLEAGKTLGMRRNGLDLIVAAGHIRTIKDARRLRLLDRADVASFQTRYVSTTELSHSLRTSARSILSRLAERGCRPAIELALGDRIEIRLYERSVIGILRRATDDVERGSISVVGNQLHLGCRQPRTE
ncbi:hypothetical protein FV222_01415 [Methylobacterium sp. WL103]|uniref:TniQ family protein n=1 Tax=Methylobacterium sp. WL103 TaxID=2603891 RepID=UPI0011C85526|nr:TniQ family protein [Methylobacterium sp. WL103]TXN08034.1 hypothetical protein FV222_01415 [Methylobacterium sp. WL103]TXN15834.1 hypothetical protein FV219_01710 [Methylobacterium sp. WL122]